MKRNATPKNATPKNATRRAWVPYLPAIITAATALVEVLLQHFHP